MTTEPPPILGPEPEAPGKPWAWFFLAIVFVLFISTSLIGYFKSDPVEQGFGLQAEAIESYINALGSPTRSPDSKKLSEAETALQHFRDQHPRAERYWAVATYLDKGKLDDAEVGRLAARLSPPNWAVALALGPTKPDTATAQLVESVLPKSAMNDYVVREAFHRAGQPHAMPSPMNWMRALLGFASFLGFFGGIAILVSYFPNVATGRIVPRGWPHIPLTLAEADSLALRVGLVLLIGYQLNPAYVLTGPLRIVGFLAVFWFLFTVPIFGQRINWKQTFGDRLSLNAAGWAMAGYIAELPLLLGALIVATMLMKFLPPSFHPINEELSSGVPAWQLFIEASLFAPFVEELLFRGMLYPALIKRLATPVAPIVVSSFLFAAIHPQGIPLWLGLASVGAVSCYVLRQTRSLWACMLLHGVHNGVLLLMSTVIFK